LVINALGMARPKSAVKHTLAPAKKIEFAKTIHYEARKGYAPPDKDIAVDLPLHWTKTSSSIHYNANLPLPSDGEGESCLNSPVRLITESS
jgi:hypothetical protein